MTTGESHPITDALGCLFVVVIVVCVLILAGSIGLSDIPAARH